MFSDERRHQIIEMLKSQKFVNVSELANHFYTSEATIRRDLDKLKKTGFVKRTYGGAALVEGINSEIPLIVREEEQSSEKEIIARMASTLIREGDVIIIDSSSTCEKLIPHLYSIKPKAVITNSPKNAIELAKSNSIKVYCTGGYLRNPSLSYVGEAARNMVSSFVVDTMFFSCRGASIDKGLTDPSEEEAELKKVMLKHSKKRILLLDSSKIDKDGFSFICNADYLDCVITETELKDKWKNYMNENHVRLIFP